MNKQPGDIKRLPFISINNCDKKDIDIVEKASKQCILIKNHLCKYSLIEPYYAISPISSGILPKDSLAKYYAYENALLTQVLLNEAIINEIVFDIYQLSERDKKMVLDKEGVTVGALSVSKNAKSAYQQWLAMNPEFAPSEELLRYVDNLPIAESINIIDDFEVLYQSHNGWEDFCIRHQCNPIEAWYQHQQKGILPSQRTQTLSFELLTDVIRALLAKDDDGIIPLTGRTGEETLLPRIEAEMIERGFSNAQIAQVFSLVCENMRGGIQA